MVGSCEYGNEPSGSIKCGEFLDTHTNNIPLRINSIPEPILIADDSSVIISSRNLEDFCSVSNLVPYHMIKLFAANKLVPHFDKMNIMKLINKDFITFYIMYQLKRKVYRRDGK